MDTILKIEVTFNDQGTFLDIVNLVYFIELRGYNFK